MISLPILERLRVDGYGLYPGQDKNHRLDIELKPGLTLILGANGLGKTTLINLMFRLLTGPFDLSVRSGAPLGTASLQATALSSDKRQELAQRVRDRAESASGALTFALGRSKITVTRLLRNLQILELMIDGIKIEPASEAIYSDHICKEAGVYAFGDFLLLLRQLVFFFEDRRALVWDSHAQTQILRALLLDPEKAKKWSELERAALSLDSDLRNTQSVMNRRERIIDDTSQKMANASSVRVEIEGEEEIQQADIKRQESLGERAAELDSSISRYRLDLLRAEHAADEAQRNVERAQLSVIERAFPSIDQNMRYIFAQLVSDGLCRACGQLSQAAVERMQRNLTEKRCAVCDLPLPGGNVVSAGELTTKRIEITREEAEKARQQLRSAQRIYHETTEDYNAVQKELAQLSDAIQQRSRTLKSLTSQLPPEEAAQRETRQAVEALKTNVESLRAQLAVAQKAYSEFVEAQKQRIHAIAEDLKVAFNEYAKGFLLEKVTLTWTPALRRMGQFSSNPLIEFPAFGVDIAGGDFQEPVRRDGPEQVSESQREFIDLAFRMALIKVVATDQAGTLVIDAPESSLDAVFVKRAASVLGHFALATNSNRLIVASNILSGDLLPEMICKSSTGNCQPQIVDLFDLGVPTAAIRQFQDEYKEVRDQLHQKISASNKT